MNEGLRIRPARLADIDAIHQLEKACFPLPWRREFFESELHQNDRFCLVALDEGRLVGYLFAMNVVDEMHINKIAVAEEVRRRGIAIALMQQCTDAAASRHVALMSLEVRQSNEGAQDFYRRLGFEKSYVRSRYYPDGEAAVVMTRKMQTATSS